MKLPVLQPGDFAYDVKAKLLAGHKFESQECVSEAGLSDATLFYLRVLILSQDDVKRCEQLLAESGHDRAAAVAHRCVSTEVSTWAFCICAFGIIAFSTCAFSSCAFGSCAFGICAFGSCAFGICAFGTCAFGIWHLAFGVTHLAFVI